MGFLSKTWKKIKGWIIPSTPKPTGFNVEKKGTNQGVPIIYGFAKKAPSVKVFKATTDTDGGAWNEYLHFICVFAVGEIEEIGQLYFNDIPEAQIDNERYFIKRFVGSESQSYCTELAAEFSLWRSTAKLKKVAYAYVRLKQNKKVDWWQGEPSIAADIKGLKVLDVRDNVIKYSENPALCTYDYLTNADYGKGLETNKINLASITTAATFIETSRTITRTVYRTWFDQESRTWMRRPDGVENETVIDNLMSCNVILDPEETIKKNVEILLGGMRAILPETDGQYRLSIEKDDAPVGAFTRDNLVGAIQCQGGSQSDRYNQVIIKFRNKLTGEADEAVYPSDDALHQEWKQADKGKLLLGEFDFDTINNKAEALQMGHVIAYRSRALIGALFNALPETIIYEAGDVVTLDSQIFGWNAKPFRIEAVEIDLETGLVNFQAVEHQNSIYPWAVNDVTEEYADTSFLFPSNLAKPTGLVFTPITDDNLKQGQLTWNDANNALVKFYRVVILDSNAAIVKSGETIETFFDVFGLGSGSYTLKVYSGNSLFLSQNENITVTLIKTTIGWDSVEGFDYEDERISNASITGFVTSDLYANEKAVLQSQIDKSITTWFYDGEPTLSSEPALNWQTTGDKNTHLGDLYYDNLTGYAHRFMINQTIYEWGKVTDSDVTKALSDAAKAQDTADGKRRVFVAEPVSPYDVGDLWDIGGAIKRCQTALVTGSYNAEHWVLVSDTTNYVDPRVSNEIAISAAAADATAKANKSTSITLKGSPEMEIVGASAVKISSDNNWNGQVYTKESFVGGAFVSAEVDFVGIAVMFGLNSDPTASAGYATLDFAFYVTGSSTVIIFESGTGIAEYGPYVKGDLFTITYDGINVKYFQNGTLLRTVSTTAERAFSFDSSFHGIDAPLNSIQFGAYVNLSAAATAAQAQATLAETTAKAYADGIVTTAEANAIAAAQTKADAAEANAISAAADAAPMRKAFDFNEHYKSLVILLVPYATSGVHWGESEVIGQLSFRRGGVGAGNRLERLDISAKTAYNSTSVTLTKSGVSWNWKTCKVYYDGKEWLALRSGANVQDARIEFWGRHTFNGNSPLGTVTNHQFACIPYYQDGGGFTGVLNTEINNSIVDISVGELTNADNVRLLGVTTQQHMPNLVSAGAGTALNVNPLSASDNGSSAKINIASHTRQYGFGVLSLNAGSITGLSFNTKYYVYYDDATYTGGAVTYNATTALQTIAAGNDRIFVSSITTPSNGGGTTQPPIYECLAFDMWLNERLQAEFVKEDDTLDLWWHGKQSVKGRVIQARQIAQKQVVYEIETCSGAIVRISENTPLELKDHVIITPKELLIGRDELATLKGDNKTLYWETVTRCEIIGEQKVVRISVGNGSFAAGLDPNNRIITHNAQQKP
jgi:hypothetical protein